MARSKTVELKDEVAIKLREWTEAKALLDSSKADEFALRNEIVQQAGFNLDKLTGTETLTINHGWKLKAVKSQAYSLSKDETIRFLQALGSIDPDLANKLVKWEPVLSESTYKNELLPNLQALAEKCPQLRELLAAALTVKPGAVQLTLTPPDSPSV